MKPQMMAEGSRSKRRKQANPRRKSVLNYDDVVETTSDTDESLANGEGGLDDEKAGGSASVSTLEASPRAGHAPWSHQDKEDSAGRMEEWRLGNNDVRSLGSFSNLNDYFLKEKLQESDGHEETIDEFLQLTDTAIIYPEAPEEMTRLSTPEALGQNETEHDTTPVTTDDFAQLLTCPYCERGYKRLTSLKEHIKYRHEKKEETFTCILCAETFTQRSHLERHMTTHTTSGDHTPFLSDEAGNRKFKCNECGKAFKYKHHLKEHLRIHSGEKPYECSNCKKRFSHSGSYSSHISSKKCISMIALNGRVRNGKPGSSPSFTTSSPGSPTLPHFRHKLENRHQLQSQDSHADARDLNEYRLLMASQHGLVDPASYLKGHGRSLLGLPNISQRPLQHLEGMKLDLPLLGYTGPLGNNLSKLLQIVDETMCLEKMDQSSEEISRFQGYEKELGFQMETSAGFQGMAHTKTIIDYTLEKVNEAKSLIESKTPVKIKKEEQNASAHLSEENPVDGKNELLSFSCQYCKETLPGPIPLHQHERYLCKMNEAIQAVLQPAESRPSGCPGFEAGETIFKDHVSMLKTYFAFNTEPNSEELLKISVAVGLPQEFVKEWFSQKKCQQQKKRPSSPELHGLDPSSSLIPISTFHLHSSFPNDNLCPKPNLITTNNQTLEEKQPEPAGQLRSNTSSPLNLSSTSSKNSHRSSHTPNSLTSENSHGDTPLDLSLHKHLAPKRPRFNGLGAKQSGRVSAWEQDSGALDPVNNKKEMLGSENNGNCIHTLENNSSSVFGKNSFTSGPVFTPLPAHGPFSPSTFMGSTQATFPGFRPYHGLDHMSFLPHMAYSFSTGSTTLADMEQRRKYQRKPGFQGQLLDGTGDFLSDLDELRDCESLLSRKKKTESGMYACDLCDKTFQKTSSLLRHKYEHTGKRPHQCQICQKAFKHKHHLIEHSRLHSGEKPYQCDKCGKRFSHSGSYSQHMNHRYSYCKREAEEREASEKDAGGRNGGGGLLPRSPESSELLRRRAYLQGPDPFRYPENLREDEGDIGLRESNEEGQKEIEVDRKTNEEEKQVVRFREKEEQEEEGGNRKSPVDTIMEKVGTDSLQTMNKSLPERLMSSHLYLDD